MTGIVTQEYWESWLGDMPKPEDATVDMMWAAYEAVKKFEDEEEDVKMIAWYTESKEEYIGRRELLLTKTNKPDFAEKLAMYDSILELIDEGLEILKERLYG